MNHHFRSYSEQPVPTSNNNNNNLNNSNNNNNNNNGFCENNLNNFFSTRNQESSISNNQATSTIMEHSDSQQSLDRLFNPQNNPQRPLRERDLPASFFNPNLGANQSFHHRSTSYNPTSRLQQSQAALASPQQQHQAPLATNNNNNTNNNGSFHHRTQSTITPMTRIPATIPTSNNSQQTSDSNSTTTQEGASENTAGQSIISNGTHSAPTNPTVNLNNELTLNIINTNTNGDISAHQHQLGGGTHHQAVAAPTATSVATPINYHQRVFSSPHFSRPNLSQQHVTNPQNQYQSTQPATNLNHNHQPSQFYNNIQQNTIAVLPQPQGPLSSSNTSPFPDSTRSVATVNQQQNYYFSSSPDIAQPPQPPPPTTLNPYFASSDSIQPIAGAPICSSQPYVSYDSALGHSSSMLNPSCQTVSSSSSNETNHSMLCMPSPAVHSRSCSFGDNTSSQPVTHIRTQSSIAGLHSNLNPLPRAYDQYYQRDRDHHQLGLSSAMNPDVGLAEIKNEIPTMSLATNSLSPSNVRIPLSPTNQDHRANSPTTFNDWHDSNAIV